MNTLLLSVSSPVPLAAPLCVISFCLVLLAKLPFCQTLNFAKLTVYFTEKTEFVSPPIHGLFSKREVFSNNYLPTWQKKNIEKLIVSIETVRGPCINQSGGKKRAGGVRHFTAMSQMI